jgi:nucleoside-triphosphatase THEP1
MGSLWASFEIIVGSFLHNLHLPFSGASLTFASVLLVIAFVQFWNDKGLIWRAGLICALMKSLSPSAVILGPMIGIMTEAFIIEIIVRLMGRNLVSYMVAGGLAVTSALIHKVISLLILYGFDIIKIFEGIYQYALKQLKFPDIEPLKLVIILVALYLVAGFIASVLGYIMGRNFKRTAVMTDKPKAVTLEFGNQLFDSSGKHRYSISLLLSHLAILLLCLWQINSGYYYIFLPLSIVYISSCFIWYRKSLRYLKKVAFWIQFMIITFLAAFLIEGYSSGNYFSSGGLIIGLKMNLRAFVIMVGFTAISTEFKNPLIRSILYNKGFASLYQSLNLAFSALPGIIAALPKSRDLFRNKKSVIFYLFNQSEILLDVFEQEHNNRPAVIIITGDVGKGKTTFVQSLTTRLSQTGINISGFFSIGIQEDNQRTGFDLMDIRTGQLTEVARKFPQTGSIKQGHYYFNPEVFATEGELLRQQLREGTDLLVIDEVGPLELNDSGWSMLIEQACRQSALPMIWIVRRSLVRRAARKWNVGDVLIFTLYEDKEEDIFEILKGLTGK